MRRALQASLGLAASLCCAYAGAAEPGRGAAPELPPAENLQHPELRDRQSSAYTLPGGRWALEVGALGIGGGDAVAKLGIAYGLGRGFEVGMNLAHAGVGLVNAGAAWHFIDTRYLDVGARLGVWYGHGEWFWIVQGPAKELVSRLDVIDVPLALVASAPVTSRFQFDLTLQYTHAEVFGAVDSDAAYLDGRLGLRQFLLAPVVRIFVTGSTELAVSSHLPLYTAMPRERLLNRETDGSRNENYETVPFSEVWSVEVGLRSRFTGGLFGRISLHYGEVARDLYGAPLYPSFAVEYRF